MSDLGTRFEAMLGRLSADERRDLLAGTEIVHLPGHVPPWTRTGVHVMKGDCVTWLAAGRIVISPELDLSGGPRFHLWGRIGDRGTIMNGPGDTFTLAARDEGPLDLAIYHGEWATPEGELATPREAYATVKGALDVCLLHWQRPGLDAAREGLGRLAALAPDEPLVAAELARLESPARDPAGWRHLWFLGQSRIFEAARADRRDAIRIAMRDDLGIVQKSAPFELVPGTTITWQWKVDSLPAQVAEDTLPTHDYLSVAVEFENGKDLSYFWSCALPVGHAFACPIPTWTPRETHLVLRSGREELGRWLRESRDLHGDCVRTYGSAPSRVVAIWLIAVSSFRHGRGEALVADIALEGGGKRLVVL
ncbi:MAG TPA: DUF3047 domain-containing protein [Myxococcota bacterium]|nr:DUF3047 domain-containing protein [Myxococcota bacterium]